MLFLSQYNFDFPPFTFKEVYFCSHTLCSSCPNFSAVKNNAFHKFVSLVICLIRRAPLISFVAAWPVLILVYIPSQLLPSLSNTTLNGFLQQYINGNPQFLQWLFKVTLYSDIIATLLCYTNYYYSIEFPTCILFLFLPLLTEDD